MQLYPLIRDLAVILGTGGLVSLLFHRIKQPVVLGYILAGAIVGPNTPPYSLVSDIIGIKTWAELGVIFLMFSLGLEFSFRKLATVGVAPVLTAGFEVFLMNVLGYYSGRFLGYSPTDSIFLGAMLSISSTTVIIKALEELKLKTKRFAEIIFALLIVEDLIAILILVTLSAFAAHQAFSGVALFYMVFKLVLVVGCWFLTGYFLVPRLMRYVGRFGTGEMLTLISLSLCLALAVFASYFDYSAALGAFIMGSIIAESAESHKIAERLEPLRDLFAAVFFVSVGMLIDPSMLWHQAPTILILAMVVICGKVTATCVGSLLAGQTLKRSLQVGLGIAQIGEFSFIIASLGMASKMTSDFIYPVGVAVSILTTFTTPYLIRASDPLARALEKRLPENLKTLLTRYGLWVHARRLDVAQKQAFYRLLAKWFINGILVSALFILSANYSLPILRHLLPPHPLAATGVTWILTVAASAPFIWAMLSTLESRQIRSEFQGVPRAIITLILRFTTLFWLGVLSRGFWSLRYTVLLTVALETLFFVFTYRQIEKYYRWFESRFFATFEMKGEPEVNSGPSEPALRHLAPWDAHLVRLKVHPNAPLATLSLSEAKIRDHFGINVIIIQRGDLLIVAPKPSELLYPRDEILVLGTDEQIEIIRPHIEQTAPHLDPIMSLGQFDLKPILVSESSTFQTKTIRHAGIREVFGAMVVGIERGGKRLINPDSDLVLQMGDILWVVGHRDHLLQLTKQGMLAAT